MQEDAGFQSAGGNGAKAYRCASCQSLIASSDNLAAVFGSSTHSFANPAGVRCDFFSFLFCPGAVGVGPPTEADSWFPGYLWSFALCRHCGEHVGWRYQAALEAARPMIFWGILISAVRPASE